MDIFEDPNFPLEVSEEEEEVRAETADPPPEPQSETLPTIFSGLLEDTNTPSIHPGVVAALKRLFELKDTQKLADDLKQAYPETRSLGFLNPEPLYDVEAHLKANKSFLALKADGFLVKLAEHQALLARPLADAMSYLAETTQPLDPKVIAERLSDIAKTIILSAKLIETARIDLTCYAFKVPTSAAKTERGVSLLGPSFAKNVERLRKDKKVLLGDEAAAPSTRYRPYARPGTDRNPPRRLSWRQQARNPDWNFTNRGSNATSHARPPAGRDTYNNSNTGTSSVPQPSTSARLPAPYRQLRLRCSYIAID